MLTVICVTINKISVSFTSVFRGLDEMSLKPTHYYIKHIDGYRWFKLFSKISNKLKNRIRGQGTYKTKCLYIFTWKTRQFDFIRVATKTRVLCLMKLLAACGRGILEELILHSPQVARNSTHKILRHTQDQFN